MGEAIAVGTGAVVTCPGVCRDLKDCIQTHPILFIIASARPIAWCTKHIERPPLIRARVGTTQAVRAVESAAARPKLKTNLHQHGDRTQVYHSTRKKVAT